MTASRAIGAAIVVAMCAGGASPQAETAALTLRATVIGSTPAETLRIELMRWSTDAERAPLVKAAAALARPPAPPAPPADPAAAAGGRAGRGGRGRGRGPEPLSPSAQMAVAIKAAPTLGFIWGEGVSGYSIKYAWRAAQPDGTERIVLVTDRRLGAHSLAWPAAAQGARGGAASAPGGPAADAEFTVVEMRVDAGGTGEAKSSLSSRVVVDPATQTLALDGYAAAPALLKVVR